MEKIKNLLRALDEFIFKQIDSFRSGPIQQQINDALSPLNPTQHKIINQVLSIGAILAPLSLVLILFFSNWGLRGEIDSKKEMLNLINSYNSQKGNLGNLGKNVIATTTFRSKSDLEARLGRILGPLKIPTNAIKVKSFASSKPKGGVSKTNINITFSRLSTRNLTDMLVNFLDQQKFRVSSIEISKRRAKDLFVKGSISLIQFGRLKK
ncbi:MAG: hypothetical protein HN509_08795 [Halobacteriovoraceae bacterium]|jgi:hypothetical protein|nr:hypothetical protein [Halobacteriovoraceae bacterium]MBT5095335.1 hypothetical protein [Halobacteriovoraceae bacterium]